MERNPVTLAWEPMELIGRDVIARNRALLVIGSLNANPADREMPPDAVRSMQIIDDTLTVRPIPFFESRAAVSNVCWGSDPSTLYLATTDNVFVLDLATGRYDEWDVPGLDGVHEIAVIDGKLWITNTSHDEIVRVDVQTGAVCDRLSLSRLSAAHSPELSDGADRFHCNQVFKGYDGDVYGLVHHHSGAQQLVSTASRLLKRHGDGGVINIATGQSRDLHLKAPHSVRLIDGLYWIFDSGRFAIRIFDRDWNPVRDVHTRAFGRGADHDPARKAYYAGMSAVRRRYRPSLPGRTGANAVQVFCTAELTELGVIAVPNIEQINSVCCLDRDVADALLSFG